jgi:hypothetical protein
MKKINYFSLITLVVIISACSTKKIPNYKEVYEKERKNKIELSQLVNPNQLQPCPSLDESKSDMYGANGKTWKFDKCWGSFKDNQTGRYVKIDCYEEYVGEFFNGMPKGYGVHYYENGDKYIGQFTEYNSYGSKDISSCMKIFKHGVGIQENKNGNLHFGNFVYNKFSGEGIYLSKDKFKQEGLWKDGKFINEKKIESLNNLLNNFHPDSIVLKLAGEINENKIKKLSKLNLVISNSPVGAEGDFVISIQTGADTASLKINDEEFGGRADGNYAIKKVARAGQETKFTIIAKDTNGNTDSKIIAVSRLITSSNQIKYAELNPALVKTQSNKDAVAIIIGIADYKNLPRADFANDDARVFYDYAIRALGVRAENIKLLVDGDAGQEEIYKAFKTWLPARVRATTDVYVYYSGHGITTNDGQSLYLLPQRTDRDLIEETAIAQSKINAAIQAAKPKSVTIFLDSCYSGVGRTGATLLASARPIAIKSTAQAFPAEFTVISASTAEQISSSSNELKHGIFSYYLMRGMEGDADTNKDGKITAGEMHTYLTENVAKQASLANRVQQPQLSGDANRVLVGR